MVFQNNLLSFHIIEKDKNNHTLLTWSYPSISEENEGEVLRNCETFQGNKFYYFRRSNKWIYLYEHESKILILKSFAICVIAKNFAPKAYETFCRILWQKYENSKKAPELVSIYLTAFTHDSCATMKNGSVVTQDFKNFEAPVFIKDFIKLFGFEATIIYISLLLKKRIIVYHNDIIELQKNLESLTKMVVQRNPVEYLFPYVQNIPEYIKSKMHFVVGVTNKNFHMKSDFFDIFINLPSKEVTILPHAKESLKLTKLHKEIATFLCELSESDDFTEGQVVNAISNRTNELRSQLKTLASVRTDDKQMITVEDLRKKKFNPTLENFLFNFAIAENMLIL